MSRLKLIAKTTWKKQGFFLVGTLILVLTWYLQNFIIDSNKEKIEDIEKMQNSFNNHLNNLREDQASYSNVTLVRKGADSVEVERRIAEVTMQNAADYCVIASEEFHLIYGEDSALKANSIYTDSLSFIQKLLEKNDWNGIKGYVSRQKEPFESAHQIAQDKALDKKHDLVATDKHVKLFSLIMYILGTVLISLNKGLDYLRGQNPDPTVETKKS